MKKRNLDEIVKGWVPVERPIPLGLLMRSGSVVNLGDSGLRDP